MWSLASAGDERHPSQGSPRSSASGSRSHRTPSGLEPVLEDKTLIASLPVSICSPHSKLQAIDV